jgi:hypothetical protein
MRGLVSLALLAACVSSVSRAAPPEYYFDCDVPPGKFSEWNRTISASGARVSGVVELIEPRRDARWMPVANLLIGGKDKTSIAGIKAYVDWQLPDVLHFILIGPGSPTSGPALLSVPWRGQHTSFTLALSESGELKVSVGNVSRSLQLTDFDARRVRVVCSTAQFKFSGIFVDSE